MTKPAATWFKPDMFALSVIRRLGGATSKPLLMESVCGSRFVVKFRNPKWRSQLLVNEFIAGLLLSRLGLPTPPVVRVAFGPEFQEPTDPELKQIVGDARAYCNSLVCLGLGFAADYSEVGSQIAIDAVGNLDNVAGAVVFDTWVYNQDARHFLGRESEGKWHMLLFDNDGAFNRHDWCISDKDNARADMNCGALRDWVRSMLANGNLCTFERYLDVLENDSIWHDLPAIKREIPPMWLDDLLPSATCSVDSLLTSVDERRRRVRRILHSFGT